MRLIDADALIKHLTDWRLQECPVGICDEETETYKTICECIEAVKRQPTACDLDSVEKELIKSMKKADYEQQSKKYGAIAHGEYKAYREAIDIVKRGGAS